MLDMYKRLKEARKDASGFTLIELLIVIVILGVLAGIVVFAVTAFNKDGQQAACKADKKNVEIALEAYYAKHSSRPASGDYAPLTNNTSQYLKEKPSTAHYSFTWNASTGVVSVGAGTDGPPANC